MPVVSIAKPVGRPLELSDAIATIRATVAPLPAVEIETRLARGFVLANDVIARDDVPFDDNSAMDGFALRSDDLERASGSTPITLRLLSGMIAAGPWKETAVAGGSTIRIMTGAPIPPGADAVVPVENAEVKGEAVTFHEPAASGQHVRKAGEDIAAGAVSLPRGTLLDPAALGIAVLSGAGKLSVHRRPVVAVLTSGDELVGANAPMKRGLVRNSNSIVLSALLDEIGCDVMELGIAPDDEAAIRERLQLGRRADVIVTSGGVSVGEKDFTRKVLDEMGLKVKFHGVNVKPGKPVLFGMLDRTAVFGLPGNPVSTHVSFELFARPAILAMAGRRKIFRGTVRARLVEEIRRKPGRPEFYRVTLTEAAGSLEARLTRERQGSGIATSNLDANGLLYVESEMTVIPAGQECLVLRMGESHSPEFTLTRSRGATGAASAP